MLVENNRYAIDEALQVSPALGMLSYHSSRGIDICRPKVEWHSNRSEVYPERHVNRLVFLIHNARVLFQQPPDHRPHQMDVAARLFEKARAIILDIPERESQATGITRY